MDDSSSRLTSESDWASEIEEENSESGCLIEKDLERSQLRHVRSNFYSSIWIVTAFNVLIFTGTLILAASSDGICRYKEFTAAGAIERAHSYCKQ